MEIRDSKLANFYKEMYISMQGGNYCSIYIFFVKVGKFEVSNFLANSYKLHIFATCNLYQG